MGEDYDLIADGAGLFYRHILDKKCSHRFFEKMNRGGLSLVKLVVIGRNTD